MIPPRGITDNNTISRVGNLLVNCEEKAKILKSNLEAGLAFGADAANKQVESVTDCLKNALDLINTPKNNFSSSINLKSFYDYLDSLTLLEESAVVHILIFILILVTLFSLASTLFVNEIIKYFNVEARNILI